METAGVSVLEEGRCTSLSSSCPLVGAGSGVDLCREQGLGMESSRCRKGNGQHCRHQVPEDVDTSMHAMLWEDRSAPSVLDTINVTRNPCRWSRIRKKGDRPRVALCQDRLIIVPRGRRDCRVRTIAERKTTCVRIDARASRNTVVVLFPVVLE